MERNFQWPPESNWPEMLCAKLGGERKTGQVNHLKLNCSSLFCCLSQRLNIIIVSEGAIDRDGNPITADAVKKVLLDKHWIAIDLWTPGCCGQVETGHKGDSVGACSGLSPFLPLILLHPRIQRGGAPSAFDRILGCRMGAEAVLALMDATPDTPSCVVRFSLVTFCTFEMCGEVF